MTFYSPIKMFFAVASPATLVSLINDIDDLGTGAELEQQELKAIAKVTLASIVGEDEMEEMIRASNP
jgi:hypothetical protein